MKKFLTLALFLILSFTGHQYAFADYHEHSYSWVLAGILNQISPQLDESQAMKMLVSCGAVLSDYLEKSGIKDEDERKEISTKLLFKYGREMRHTVDWDSTIAEFMVKKVSFEELKQLDSSINHNIANSIIKSEKISEKLCDKKTKGIAALWMASKMKGTFKKIDVKKCEKSYKKAFDTFYRESGNKQLASGLIDEIKNDNMIRVYADLPKLIESYKADLEKNLYNLSLNIAIDELTEEELIKVTEQYQSGILLKYMSVTRELQRNQTPMIQSFLKKFAKWVEVQDEWKQLGSKKK